MTASSKDPAMTGGRPILIYDGDCNFCRRWVARWRQVTQDRIEYASSKEIGQRFPEIPPEKFLASVILVDADRTFYEGAEAVFRTLALSPNRRWPWRLYRSLPGFAPVAEWTYRFVADHRTGFSRLTRWLWGDSVEPPSFFLVRKVFLIALCFIYFMAFASLWVQIPGLMGSEGIAPAKEYLEVIRSNTGTERFRLFPTLFWFHVSDGFLNALCLAGMGLSLLPVFGIFPAPVFFLLWVLYLSFLTISRDFMAFQWDILLLEAGFLAIFFAPVRGRLKPASDSPPSGVVLFLYRFLLFRVIFSSGAVKLASGDPSWREMTALQFHYETQPLPTWAGWYAHQLPPWFQEFSVGAVFFIQLLLPFLIFAPRRPRLAAGLVLAVFQGLIGITGNYCFFNLLTMALCLLLLDDACLEKIFPKKFMSGWMGSSEKGKRSSLKTLAVDLLAALVLLIGIVQYLTPLVFRDIRLPAAVQEITRWVSPYHLVNPYGLFAVMTTVRNEIIVEGSHDGTTWKAYEFKWKPGDVKRAPAFVAPHQPRLDWQMWFAALTDYRRQPWFLSFMSRLLGGSESVLRLLAHNPFPDAPPKFLRAVVYRYRFTDISEWRKDQSWWRREWKGIYTPVIKIKDP